MSSGEPRFELLPDSPPERLRSGVQPTARASNHQGPRELDDDECEGVALALLTEAGIDTRTSPLPPHLVARALGLRLSPLAPSGCRGANDNVVLRYDGRGERETVAQRLAHELAHVAAARGGIAPPHAEGSIDRIAMAIALPRPIVRATLTRTGLDPLRLLAELPGAAPAWVILRAAWVARRPVIVRLAGERWAYAPDGGEIPPAGAWERDMVAIVRRTERPHRTLLGDEAWPVGFREHLGVVIALRL
jgi:hypothetical protein